MTEINFVELIYPAKFSNFMNQLLNLKFGAIAIRPPYDRGRDSYEVKENGDIRIFQYKYFPIRMNSTQEKDVDDSLKTALRNYPDCKEWSLCFPREMSSGEEDFLKELSKKYKVKISFIGESILKNLCHETKFPLEQYFDSHMHKQTDKKINEILEKIENSKKTMNFATINKVIKELIRDSKTELDVSGITISIDIKTKIKINNLSYNFEQILLKQMTKFSQIDSYLKSGALKSNDIDNMLIALKMVYMKFKNYSSGGDEIFLKMVETLIPQNATEEENSAYCALICYFFHSCEVFENVVA